MSFRCDACGNRTRFDVFESKRVRAFQHFSLGGEMTIEEEEVLDHNIERVVCRWCGSSDVVDESTPEQAAAGAEEKA